MKARDTRWHGRKLHVYIPPEMLLEIHAEATRLGVKTSGLMRRVWRMSRPGLASLPTSAEGEPMEATREGNDADLPRRG